MATATATSPIRGLPKPLAPAVEAYAHRPVFGVGRERYELGRGAPRGTAGLGPSGAKNAAHFAAQILGVPDSAIAKRVAALRAADGDAGRAKDAKVRAEHPVD